MEKFFVADSYKDMTVLGEPFKNPEKKNRKYVRVKGKCPRCGGLGFIVSRVHNGKMIPVAPDGGVCYLCHGDQYIVKEVRAYTEKEYATLQKSKERAKKRKEAETAARERDLSENADKYKHEIALKLGFGEDEKVYLVYGDDTYHIKDELKKMGAKFDPTLKWYFSEEVNLPVGYKLCSFSFDELYDYKIQAKWANFKEDAKEIVRRRLAELQDPSPSEYYPAEVKERIRNVIAKVSKIRGFNGMYGYTFVYTFKSGNYVFIWMTAKELDIAIGDLIDLTGTIKKFDEYLGELQTHLTRCVIKKLN